MNRILKPILELAVSEPIRSVFSSIFINRLTYRSFNILYERLPHYMVELLVRLARQPDFDFEWHIFLPNGKKCTVLVSAADPMSFQFALSYKWHDIGLRMIETQLNDRISKDLLYIDIGANLGLRSVYSLSSGRKSVLFEPNKNLKKFTEYTFRKNSFSGYKIENICLSNSSGKTSFYLSPSSYLSSIEKTHAQSDTNAGNVEEVISDKMKLDEYLNANNPEDIPGIVKIDVEGHEFEVAEGAIETFRNFMPVLLIEILRGSPKSVLLYRMLKDMSYKCYAILNKPRLSLHKIADEKDLMLNLKTDNYLFTPNAETLKAFIKHT